MMEHIGISAKKASQKMVSLSTDVKNNVLKAVSKSLVQRQEEILVANQMDYALASENNIGAALLDRLLLNEGRIQSMADGISVIVQSDDPIGTIQSSKMIQEGLSLEKITVPLGVVGIIYESRPNVSVDAFALSFKAGNAIILKGGKEAIESNKVLVQIIQDVLEDFNLDPNTVQLIERTDREATYEFMKMDSYVDVLIPRGSAALIKATVLNSTIPIIKTGDGNCHLYVHESYDEKVSLDIVENGKCQRVGVCNALESLVVDRSIAANFIPKMITRLKDVTFVGDLECMSFDSRIEMMDDHDYAHEYLDLKMSIKLVDTVSEAIEHINTYNTQHSDAIIAQDESVQNAFIQGVDTACLYVNASTRFTDGAQFGLGAEMGVSTQKLHVRGPMGLESLCSYKYIIKGNGHTRS